MNLTLRIIVMFISLLVFSSVIFMMIRHQLNESNSILWLMIATVILVFGFKPDILNLFASLTGISYAPTLLFLVSTIMLMLISFKSSLELSKMSEKINELTIAISILKEENNRLAVRIPEEAESEVEERYN